MTRISASTISILAVCSFIFLTAGVAAAAFPGQNGRIAFTADDEQNPGADYGVWTMNGDGSNPMRLTSEGVQHNDLGPAWSPDGMKIAFIRNHDVWTMNADGSNQVRLTDQASDPQERRNLEPAWSPDGSRIAFNRSGEIWVMNADGSQQVDITASFGHGATEPNWSPDGSRIAITGNFGPGESTDIYVVQPDGTGVTDITNSTGDESLANWSPDGSKLAYTLRFVGVQVMSANGTGRTFVSTGFSPAWSPDGKKISLSENNGVYTVNTDGSQRAFLHRGTDPDWQPVRPPPKRSDYKNAASFCAAERDFLGEQEFTRRFGANGNGANAYGKCVSQN